MEEVLSWAEQYPNTSRQEFSLSAAEVIAILKEIEQEVA